MTFELLLDGFRVALAPSNLVFSFVGVLIGNLFGVLPGIGPLTAISMLLPLTYTMSPTAALMMLAGIYYGAQYGGAITSILINVPGVPSHAITCLDGHPLARQGKAGQALFVAVFASFLGACIGIVIMMLFSPAIVELALKFGPAEYFALMLLGLLAASTLSRGSALKSIAMVIIGLILGLAGTDVTTGYPRFTFGIPELADGINLVALALGLFALSETLSGINSAERRVVDRTPGTRYGMWPERGVLRRMWTAIGRGSALGSFFGVLPGTGPTVASYMAYAVEKKLSRTPRQFGQGAIEGIAGPEASNNAAAQTAFVPTLTLGIPGEPLMALMLSAMVIQGIQPGPQMLTDHPEVFWGLVASFWVGNFLLLILNVPFIGIWVRLLSIPYHLFFPALLFFVCVGVYSTGSSLFDVGLTLGIGVAAFALIRMGFEPAPLLLGFVLGPPIEENLRRALLISDGDASVFVQSPTSAVIMVLCLAVVVAGLFKGLRAGAGVEGPLSIPAETPCSAKARRPRVAERNVENKDCALR